MVPQHFRLLFWDIRTDTFVPTDYLRYTIARVLEHGDAAALAWVKRLFTDAQIVETIRTSRSLSRHAARHWARVYGIQPKQVSASRSHAGLSIS